MKRVLITGSNGFIGKNLAQQLSADYTVFAPGSRQLDLTDQHAVKAYLHREQFDVLIHSAALLDNRNTCPPQDMLLEKNLRMFFNLEGCRDEYGKMLYFGSGAAYGRNLCPPLVKESHLGRHIPWDPYGFSKYIMANTAQASRQIYDLTLFGVFGKYEDWRIRFISNACCCAVLNLPIKIKQNLFFDYLYVEDLVTIVRWFMEHQPQHQRYHVCTGSRIDLYTLAQMVKIVSGKDINIQVAQQGYGCEYTGDNQRLMDELGEFAFTSLHDSIAQLYQYYLENQPAIDKESIYESP